MAPVSIPCRVELQYSLHSSFGMTPFEIIYGKPPPTILDYVTGMTNNEVVQTFLKSRQQLHSKLKQRLKKAQDAMKRYVDVKCDDITFE